MLDEQTAAVRPNADVTRVVAMLQSTAVPTELGGGSLWQHIGEALKASFEQSQPHVRAARRACGANALLSARAPSALCGDTRRSRACRQTFARVAEYRLNGQQCSSGATQQCAQQSPVRQQTVICRRMGAPIGRNAAQQATTIARVLRCTP